MPSTPHLLLFLSIHWMQSCGFECNHEQWGLRFRFPLLLAQLLMRSINASLLSRFDSRAFFSFYSTTLSLYLNLSLLLCPCVPSFDCSLYWCTGTVISSTHRPVWHKRCFSEWQLRWLETQRMTIHNHDYVGTEWNRPTESIHRRYESHAMTTGKHLYETLHESVLSTVTEPMNW